MSANPSKRNPTALRVVPAPSPAADAYRVLAAAQERLRDEALRSYVATQNRNDRRVTLAFGLAVCAALVAVTVWVMG